MAWFLFLGCWDHRIEQPCPILFLFLSKREMKTTLSQMKSLSAKCDYHILDITWTSNMSSITNDANNVYLQCESFRMKAGCSLLELRASLGKRWQLEPSACTLPPHKHTKHALKSSTSLAHSVGVKCAMCLINLLNLPSANLQHFLTASSLESYCWHAQYKTWLGRKRILNA